MTKQRKKTGRAVKEPMSPWEKILRASERGTGLRLTWDDINSLAGDDAIMHRARLDRKFRTGETDDIDG